eukprot:CAMPEP_0176127520 /NCGR_PEP_ID=MMETSP0120_2-20121206/64408_1 /TAXON_ID=160619 /ORGANISM="Kryptoperidinium foliaceum, Strain CCMP 1326" /LENGTH=40 /DNA_ID= /DNA_START= /DNA_END= /DNA_ORIENTATION=
MQGVRLRLRVGAAALRWAHDLCVDSPADAWAQNLRSRNWG